MVIIFCVEDNEMYNIIIAKSIKGNGVVILSRKLYDDTILKIISKKLDKDSTLKHEASLSWNKKIF